MAVFDHFFIIFATETGMKLEEIIIEKWNRWMN